MKLGLFGIKFKKKIRFGLNLKTVCSCYISVVSKCNVREVRLISQSEGMKEIAFETGEKEREKRK